MDTAASDDLPLILASESPRRRDLMREAGYSFTVVAPRPGLESGPRDGESPEDLVARLASAKAAEVATRIPRGLVIACDTVVACRGRILGKPRDADDARRMLGDLSGREQRVVSGLCLHGVPSGQVRVEVDVARLRMARLDESAIEDYVRSGLWEGKAGGFGLQDRNGWLEIVAGSSSSIVGLPLERLARMLDAWP
ncbi:MAG: septum formation protein Maf [Planctomycetes bacterium]|nr:septum formation protein Maf [Planctomycetota bacterium]